MPLLDPEDRVTLKQFIYRIFLLLFIALTTFIACLVTYIMTRNTIYIAFPLLFGMWWFFRYACLPLKEE